MGSTDAVAQGDAAPTAVTVAVAGLLGELKVCGPGEATILGVVATRLAALANALGVARVTVAVDDERLGRQLFTSGRATLGDDVGAIWGDAGVWTDPEAAIEPAERRLLVDAVALAAALLPADEPRGGDALQPQLDEAVARAVEHGWTFALVLVRFDARLGADALAAIRARLSPGDSVVACGPADVAVLLPATVDTEVPARLERASAAGGWGPCVYGIAHCPGDARSAAELLAHAARGLALADAARNPSADVG